MKKMMMMAMAAMMALAMVACNKSTKTCPLAGEWAIESVGELTAIEDFNQPTMTIADGEAFGQTGCNSFRGAVKCCAKKQTVSFGEMATTMMFCHDSEKQERAILAAFANTVSFAIEDNTLYLKDTDNNVLMTLKKL